MLPALPTGQRPKPSYVMSSLVAKQSCSLTFLSPVVVDSALDPHLVALLDLTTEDQRHEDGNARLDDDRVPAPQ